MIRVLNEHIGKFNDSVLGVTVSKVDGNWVTGKVDGNWFEAKIFAKPSEFGIFEGRISKLTISKDAKPVMNYDRGWDFGRKNNPQLQKLICAFGIDMTPPIRDYEGLDKNAE